MIHEEIFENLKRHHALFDQYRKDNTARFADPSCLIQFNQYAMALGLGAENLGCRDCIMNLVTKLSRWYFERLEQVVVVEPEEVKPVQQQLFTNKKKRRRR